MKSSWYSEEGNTGHSLVEVSGNRGGRRDTKEKEGKSEKSMVV